MTTAQSFSVFLNNIKVDSESKVSPRYKEITQKLNRTFRNTDSETDNSLMVGSYGRYTGIKGISDLDMIYIMPNRLFAKYKSDQSKLLQDTKSALQERYPKTDITYDQILVQVKFSDDFMFEVQPVFEGEPDAELPVYWFPDTRAKEYKKTMPKHEQRAMTDFREQRGDHHRHLCKMVRAWKDNAGVLMGGLLIDTLTYNFLNSNTDYQSCTYSRYDCLVRDFFEFLKNQPAGQTKYYALGSNQEVKVKHPFRSKAREAYKLACKAIDEENEFDKNERWRDLFGKNFPKVVPENEARAFSSTIIKDKEQFIEDIYPVRLQNSVKIGCSVEQPGFRIKPLQEILKNTKWLSHNLSLHFFIDECDVQGSYYVRWKIRNVGPEAKRRNCLRGEIQTPNEKVTGRKESTNFYGPHYVECYIIQNGVVVARDRIDVPIER